MLHKPYVCVCLIGIFKFLLGKFLFHRERVILIHAIYLITKNKYKLIERKQM